MRASLYPRRKRGDLGGAVRVFELGGLICFLEKSKQRSCFSKGNFAVAQEAQTPFGLLVQPLKFCEYKLNQP